MRHLARGAFGWIVDHVDDFRIGAAAGRRRMTAVKRLAELATLAAATLEVHAEARRLLDFAWDELGRGRAIAEVLDVHPAIAIAYLPFRRVGTRSPALERILAERSWRAGHRDWSSLDRYVVGTILEAIGVAPPWSQTAALEGLERLVSSEGWPFALHVEVMAHVVMWRTSMGVEWASLSLEETATFQARLPAWTARLAADGLLDPLAELLVANACVRGAPLAQAWQPILGAQRPDGSVPPLADLAGARFDDVYHSTLVAALAATMASRARRPRIDVPVSAALSHYAD